MALGPNLLRRGSVYHWRRRIPSQLVPCMEATHLRISLNTKDSKAARYLGAQLDAIAMDIFGAQTTQGMSKAQLASLFRTAHNQHRKKLDLLADIERGHPTTDRSQLLALELARGEAYRLLSERGANAQIDVGYLQRLEDKGYDAQGVARILEELEALRDPAGIHFSMSKLRRLIEAAGAPASSINLAQALPVYLRALAEALLTAPQRYGAKPTDAVDFAALVANTEQETAVEKPAVAVRRETALEPAGVAPVPTASSSAALGPAPDPSADGRVETIARKLIDRKVNAKSNAALRAEPGTQHEARAKAKGWDDKAVRQAEGIFDLFGRYLREEYGFDDLALLRQRHLAGFEEFLRQLNSNFGKSPKDKSRTIADLRAVAAEVGPKVGTLLPGTLNRHLTYLGQLIRHAKAAGVVMAPDLSTEVLRAEQPDRSRNLRAVPAEQAVAALFHGPAFTGCAAWDRPGEPGDYVYHRALYFVSLLSVYGGGRREEYCGLSVDDVVDDTPNPYVMIRFNDIRRLKNGQSIRSLALHPELIRLGFIPYVRAMRDLGYHRLFEDLYSPTSRSPMGDRYYDELLPALRDAGVTPHQLRHFFNDALKQQEVAREFRADLLGHMGEGETDERYCNPTHIKLQLKQLAKLPIVSAHLQARPILLLPWIAERRLAPWSRAAAAEAAGIHQKPS